MQEEGKENAMFQLFSMPNSLGCATQVSPFWFTLRGRTMAVKQALTAAVVVAFGAFSSVFAVILLPDYTCVHNYTFSACAVIIKTSVG